MAAVGILMLVVLLRPRLTIVVLGVFVSLYFPLTHGLIGISVPSWVREALIVATTMTLVLRERGRLPKHSGYRLPLVFAILFIAWGLVAAVWHGLSSSTISSFVLNCEFVVLFVVMSLWACESDFADFATGYVGGVAAGLALAVSGLSYMRTDAYGNVVNVRLWESTLGSMLVNRQTWAFGDPNNAGLALAWGVGLAVWLAFGSPRWRKLGLVVASVSLAALIMTYSRASYVVIVAFGLSLLPVLRSASRHIGFSVKTVRGVVISLTAVVMIMAATQPLLAARFISIFDFTHPSNAAHVAIAGDVLEQIPDAPVLGHGWSSIGVFAGRTATGYAVADNHYLQYAYQIGLPGLLLFCAVLLTLLVRGLQVVRRDDYPPVLPLAAMLFGTVGIATTANAWEMFPSLSVFWVCAGFLIVRHRQVYGNC
jgi:O-antigen ligase